MEDRGPLWRTILESPVWQLPPATTKIAIYCLLQGGGFLTSRARLAMANHVSEQQARDALEALELCGFLAVAATRRGTLVTVLAPQANNQPNPQPDAAETQQKQLSIQPPLDFGNQGNPQPNNQPKRRKQSIFSAEELRIAKAVLDKLNENLAPLDGRRYQAVTSGGRPCRSNVAPIVRLIRDPDYEASEFDLRLIVWAKSQRWGPDEKMREYLRPETLFAPTRYHGYLTEARAAWVRAGGKLPSPAQGELWSNDDDPSQGETTTT